MRPIRTCWQSSRSSAVQVKDKGDEEATPALSRARAATRTPTSRPRLLSPGQDLTATTAHGNQDVNANAPPPGRRSTDGHEQATPPLSRAGTPRPRLRTGTRTWTRRCESAVAAMRSKRRHEDQHLRQTGGTRGRQTPPQEQERAPQERARVAPHQQAITIPR